MKKIQKYLPVNAIRFTAADGGEDRCPKCDHPTPIVKGWCECNNCGHIWRAGSH
ncbi:MAG: hypothetical protein IKS32_03725 [Solobacterium sp.]|nr:hypothetical protein [Solobacterium sp.]